MIKSFSLKLLGSPHLKGAFISDVIDAANRLNSSAAFIIKSNF